MNLSFNAPTAHLSSFLSHCDFYTAWADRALRDPKYRERLRPIALLMADVMPLADLRRVVTLTHPANVSVGPLDGSRKEMEIQLRHVQLAIEADVALVVPLDDTESAELAIAEDVPLIIIPPSDQPGSRLLWAQEIQLNSPVPQWFHFDDITSMAEFRRIYDVGFKLVSLTTAWPITSQLGPWDMSNPLPDDILAQAVEVAELMHAAVSGEPQ